jgi:phenylpropionate dioxygenase-like ring-hydroxylating dioxygenase large terminal subunit
MSTKSHFLKPAGAVAMFVKNCWYVAAFTGEIKNRPLARRFVGEPVVLYRQSDGKFCALEDRCCHRGLPLSMGEVIGDLLRCQYHGLEYNRSGTCVKIPGQDVIPPTARVKAYPIAVRGQAIWIWMGDAKLANEALIPAFPWFDDPSWDWKFKVFNIKCNYEMLHDNLLDLTHLAYVHGKTIGGTPAAHFNAETKVTKTDRGVKVARWLPDSVPPSTYSKLVDFNGNVDRWQEFEFFPGLISLYTGAVDVGTGAYEGKREGGFHLRIFDAITPETEDSTLNLFCAGQNVRPGEPEVTRILFDELETTVMEDIEVLEAQHQRVRETKDRAFVYIWADAAGLQTRKAVDKMRQQESRAGA